MKLLIALAFAALCSCTTLPRPDRPGDASQALKAGSILRTSARASGDPWRNGRTVTASYDGRWSAIVPRLQPELTDTAFRKTSVETFSPDRGTLRQVHQGPGGTKTVVRQGSKTKVTYNGLNAEDEVQIAAAALVADAYTAFLFGSSYLAARAGDLTLLPPASLAGETCNRVQGSLSPGFGNSDRDHFIAWIGTRFQRLLRLQITLNGLESTRGADVDVAFSDFRTSSGESIWPHGFKERVRRPFDLHAHEWRLTRLRSGGDS